MTERSLVVVVGGGIIGLSLATCLLDNGHRVTLLEPQYPLAGASVANAGWVETQTMQPLPSPSALRFGLTSMARRNAPLRIRPRASFALGLWLLRFAVASRPGEWERGRQALIALGEGNGDYYRRLAAQIGFRINSNEALEVFGDERGAQRVADELSLDPAAIELLDAAAVRRREPMLSERAQSGLILRGDVQLEPDSLMAALRADVDRRGTITRAVARSFVVDNGVVTAIETDRGTLASDQFVVAAGTRSEGLVRPLGTRLPLQMGTGYSFEVDLPHPPSRMVSLADAKVGIVPHRGGARLNGTMDLSGGDDNVRLPRVRGILDAVEPYLRHPLRLPADLASLPGLMLAHRPMTSDGLPVIDRLPGHDNVFVSTGHAMMGVTLAPGSARALAEFVRTGDRPAVLDPFRIGPRHPSKGSTSHVH